MKIGELELNRLYVGDAKELAAKLPDNSIDLIYTDPPYPREFIHTFYEMGEYAGRILKPGGSLITLCGHYQVPDVIYAMKSPMQFRWMGWLVHSGPKRTLFGYRVVCGGKPLLWFSKGKARQYTKGFWWDTKEIRGMKRDKRYHEWGQSESYVIQDLSLLTEPEDVVLDPFCGGGTVPAVCKMLGRNWLTFEINAETAGIAQERIDATVQAMFTDIQYEQSEMELQEGTEENEQQLADGL